MWKKLNLGAKIALTLVFPMAGLLVFSVQGVSDRASTARECRDMGKMAVVTNKLGDLVHELQIERGRSSGYLGSMGKKFSAELPPQRAATDRKIADLKAALHDFEASAFGAGFQRAMEAAVGQLAELGRRREQVTALKVPAPEAIRYYSATIGACLDVITQLARVSRDAGVTRETITYTSFLFAKENMGIERATLSNVFAKNEFAPGMFERAISASAAQDAFLKTFLSLATEGQKTRYASTVRGRAVEEVARMKAVALEHASQGGFGIDADAWFDAMTQKINLMREVENGLGRDLSNSTARIRAAAERALALVSSLTLAMILLSVVCGAMTIRSITRSLKELIGTLGDESEGLTSRAAEVATSSDQLARNATQQAASLEEASASLEEMTASVRASTDQAGRAFALSTKNRAIAEAGVAEARSMTEAMAAIRTSNIGVGQIVTTIDEIAFLTNILALNAAVEAARAGAAGAGFGVVADGVRTLARRSAQAAKESAEKIEDSIARSEQGARMNGRVVQGLEGIVLMARQVDELIAGISAASQQQNRGIEDINRTVVGLRQTTQLNAAGAEESASAATELAAQAGSLEEAAFALALLVGGKHGIGRAA
jgi:methyl-accepting chemotaxis protein